MQTCQTFNYGRKWESQTLGYDPVVLTTIPYCLTLTNFTQLVSFFIPQKTNFAPLVSFFISRKHQKPCCFLKFSWGIERDKWHYMNHITIKKLKANFIQLCIDRYNVEIDIYRYLDIHLKSSHNTQQWYFEIYNTTNKVAMKTR